MEALRSRIYLFTVGFRLRGTLGKGRGGSGAGLLVDGIIAD